MLHGQRRHYNVGRNGKSSLLHHLLFLSVLETTPKFDCSTLMVWPSSQSRCGKARCCAKSIVPQIDDMNLEIPTILACTTRSSRLEPPNSHQDVATATSKDVLQELFIQRIARLGAFSHNLGHYTLVTVEQS